MDPSLQWSVRGVGKDRAFTLWKPRAGTTLESLSENNAGVVGEDTKVSVK